MNITVDILSPEDASWFGSPVLLRAEYPNHFPTGVICGVVNRRYTDTNQIGYKIRGVMGSSCVGIGLHGVEKAKKLLAAAGHNVMEPSLVQLYPL